MPVQSRTGSVPMLTTPISDEITGAVQVLTLKRQAARARRWISRHTSGASRRLPLKVANRGRRAAVRPAVPKRQLTGVLPLASWGLKPRG